MALLKFIANYFLLFCPFVYSQKQQLKGRLFANMRPCPLPIVRLMGQSSNTETTTTTENFSLVDFPINSTITTLNTGNPLPIGLPPGSFQLELTSIHVSANANWNITIEAECASKEPGESPLKSTYNLDLAKIDWEGANLLLLFNDVNILAFGYPGESDNIGMA